MDLNANSEKVWGFYRETLSKLAASGARILRLDAFAYLHKEVGLSNFFNVPGTWDYLGRLRAIAEEYGLILLPEIHSEYGTGLHEQLSDQDYPIYDFFFPGLVIDALDSGESSRLRRWIGEIIDRDLKTVNMLGCHDGIPVIDLKGGEATGLVDDVTIDAIIDRVLDRGGRVKNLYGPDGTKISYYQVNATFFSALGESESRLRLARAIQLFMPGTPQVWYLDLFAGVNDYAAADRGGSAGHKEINRTNLTAEDIEAGLQRSVVQDQLEMMRLRNTSSAFSGELTVVDTDSNRLVLRWANGDTHATLDADLAAGTFSISHVEDGHETVLNYT
jgi:sucrose phosphorylase